MLIGVHDKVYEYQRLLTVRTCLPSILHLFAILLVFIFSLLLTFTFVDLYLHILYIFFSFKL